MTFDVLIIDEVQDLLTELYIEVLNSILKGGIDSGKWIFFGDFNNQSIFIDNSKERLNNLKERTNFVSFPRLKINCRNSINIANLNTLITGTEKLEVKSMFTREKIIDIFTDNSIGKVIEILNQLEVDKVDCSQVSVLSVNKNDIVELKLSLEYLRLVSTQCVCAFETNGQGTRTWFTVFVSPS